MNDTAPAQPTALNKTIQAIKPALPAMLMLAALAIGSDAGATGTGTGTGAGAIKQLETNLSAPLCQVYDVLTGWFTVLLIVIAVAIGGLMKLFGSRNWSSMIIGALVAGVIVFLSGTIVKIVLSGSEIKCADAKIRLRDQLGRST